MVGLDQIQHIHPVHLRGLEVIIEEDQPILGFHFYPVPRKVCIAPRLAGPLSRTHGFIVKEHDAIDTWQGLIA